MKKNNMLPDHVEILSHRYDIEYNIILHDDNIGFIKDKESLIEISNTLPPESIKYVLWHEIFHGVDFAVGASLSEEQVTALANATLDVMRRNKKIIEFIAG